MIRRIKRLIFRVCRLCPPLYLFTLYWRSIYIGYRNYAKLRRKYGVATKICSCAYNGTGDYYFCGMYLGAWLNGNKDFIFLTPGGSQLKVMGLFEIFKGHVLKLKYPYLTELYTFAQTHLNYYYFHYASYPNAVARMIDKSPLFGYRGLEMLDFYYFGGLPQGVQAEMPDFATSESPPKKAIVLSPYAASCKMSSDIWAVVAKKLTDRSYNVLTNCGANEQPIPRTEKLFLPYKQSVPYLNQCVGFIGVRSGLCDIVSTSTCRKVIIHPYKAINWPDGSSLKFTGLTNMGLCDDVVEIEESDNVVKKVLELFP
jgi:hypothetical protein